MHELMLQLSVFEDLQLSEFCGFLIYQHMLTTDCFLAFRHRASSIYDRHFATLQRTLFIFNQQIYFII